jgi:hypothetical protein
VSQYTWIDIVNRDYDEAEPGCLPAVISAVELIAAAGSTEEGRESLAVTFGLCDVQTSAQPLVDYFTDAVRRGMGFDSIIFRDTPLRSFIIFRLVLWCAQIETLPQMDYPYAIGSMPAWPVNATCDMMVPASKNSDPQALLEVVPF